MFSMLWRYAMLADSAEIDKLLEKEDLTLTELLEADGILSQCRQDHEALIDHLCREETFDDLIKLVLTEPEEQLPMEKRFIHQSTATDILTSGVAALEQQFLNKRQRLQRVVTFIGANGCAPINPLSVSFVYKLFEHLWTKHPALLSSLIEETQPNFTKSLFRRPDVSRTGELLLKICSTPRQRLLSAVDHRDDTGTPVIRSRHHHHHQDDLVQDDLVQGDLVVQDDRLNGPSTSAEAVDDVDGVVVEEIFVETDVDEDEGRLSTFSLVDGIVDMALDMLMADRTVDEQLLAKQLLLNILQETLPQRLDDDVTNPLRLLNSLSPAATSTPTDGEHDRQDNPLDQLNELICSRRCVDRLLTNISSSPSNASTVCCNLDVLSSILFDVYIPQRRPQLRRTDSYSNGSGFVLDSLANPVSRISRLNAESAADRSQPQSQQQLQQQSTGGDGDDGKDDLAGSVGRRRQVSVRDEDLTLPVLARIDVFTELLRQPPVGLVQQVAATWGGQARSPLGRVRLSIIRLLNSLFDATSTTYGIQLQQAMAREKTLSVIIDLFFEYEQHSLWHKEVSSLIQHLLSTVEAAGLSAGSGDRPLSLDDSSVFGDAGDKGGSLSTARTMSEDSAFERPEDKLSAADTGADGQDDDGDLMSRMAGQFPLLLQLTNDCRFLERIVESFADQPQTETAQHSDSTENGNEVKSSASYRGHLLAAANQFNRLLELAGWSADGVDVDDEALQQEAKKSDEESQAQVVPSSSPPSTTTATQSTSQSTTQSTIESTTESTTPMVNHSTENVTTTTSSNENKKRTTTGDGRTRAGAMCFVGQLFDGLPVEARRSWRQFTKGQLAEFNRVNSHILGGKRPDALLDDDDDDELGRPADGLPFVRGASKIKSERSVDGGRWPLSAGGAGSTGVQSPYGEPDSVAQRLFLDYNTIGNRHRELAHNMPDSFGDDPGLIMNSVDGTVSSGHDVAETGSGLMGGIGGQLVAAFNESITMNINSSVLAFKINVPSVDDMNETAFNSASLDMQSESAEQLRHSLANTPTERMLLQHHHHQHRHHQHQHDRQQQQQQQQQQHEQRQQQEESLVVSMADADDSFLSAVSPVDTTTSADSSADDQRLVLDVHHVEADDDDDDDDDDGGGGVGGRDEHAGQEGDGGQQEEEEEGRDGQDKKVKSFMEIRLETPLVCPALSVSAESAPSSSSEPPNHRPADLVELA